MIRWDMISMLVMLVPGVIGGAQKITIEDGVSTVLVSRTNMVRGLS